MSDTNESPKPDDQIKDLTKAIDSLISKHGDSNGALRVLLSENHDLRDKLRDTRAKLPADGSVVLSGDQAKAWGEYRAFGNPTDLRKTIDDGKAASGELAGLRKEKHLGEVATLAGYKPAVLARLASDLEISLVDGKGKDGKAAKVPTVKGEGGKDTPLAEYAELHWADFLPALKADSAASPTARGTPPRATHSPATSGATPGGELDSIETSLRRSGVASF